MKIQERSNAILVLFLTIGLANIGLISSCKIGTDLGSSTESDDTAPSTPKGLTATPLGQDMIAVTWDPCTDENGVYAYEVYRNGHVAAYRGGTSTYLMSYFVDQSSKAQDSDYSYSVRVYDKAGNYSESGSVTVRPLAATRAKTTIYVDDRLSCDLADGTYDIGSRSGGGTDGKIAYRTIQAALASINVGDTILMRGGTYYEYDITVPLEHTAESWDEANTLSSYPGEWAIVDGQHHEDPDTDATPKTYCVFRSSGSGERSLRYWRFAWFEVTGGGPALTDDSGSARTYDDIQPLPGKGFQFWPARHVVFDHLYVHDNYGGGGPNGGAGISVQSESGGAQYIEISYCRLSDNGWPDSINGNLANIVFFTDYAWRNFPDIDASIGASHNEVHHNLLQNSATGFKHKGTQYLSLNHEGTDMAYCAAGDRFHHNVVEGCHTGLLVCQDFAQIYNNVVIDSAIGICVGYPPTTGYREPFHVVAYNNTVVDSQTDLVIYKGSSDTVYNYLDSPYHPYFHSVNNIIVNDAEEVHGEGGPILVMPTYTRPITADLSTIDIRNILFFGRSATDDSIRIGMDNYSAQAAVSEGFGEDLWAVETGSLFQGNTGASAFKPYAGFSLEPVDGGTSTTIGTGGDAGTHPYLSETFPDYVGAVDPTDDVWVDDVFELNDLGTDLLPEG